MTDDLRLTRIPLNNGSGHIPALGCGTLTPDLALTKTLTRDALAAGFRHFDCAERYRNEREVGEGVKRRTFLWEGQAGRPFHYHKVVEHQSSTRARRTGI